MGKRKRVKQTAVNVVPVVVHKVGDPALIWPTMLPYAQPQQEVSYLRRGPAKRRKARKQ